MNTLWHFMDCSEDETVWAEFSVRELAEATGRIKAAVFVTILYLWVSGLLERTENGFTITRKGIKQFMDEATNTALTTCRAYTKTYLDKTFDWYWSVI